MKQRRALKTKTTRRKMSSTLDFYNHNAEKYFNDTVNINFDHIHKIFIDKLNKGNTVLDFGCGSGRDTKYFLSMGLNVEAIDGSKEMCRLASEYTGINVKRLRFEDFEEINRYNGVWACASLLHLSKNEIYKVMGKLATSLKANGIIYVSFKNTKFEGKRNERYFTDFTIEEFRHFIREIKGLYIEKAWITDDYMPDRPNWSNFILRKGR